MRLLIRTKCWTKIGHSEGSFSWSIRISAKCVSITNDVWRQWVCDSAAITRSIETSLDDTDLDHHSISSPESSTVRQERQSAPMTLAWGHEERRWRCHYLQWRAMVHLRLSSTLDRIVYWQTKANPCRCAVIWCDFPISHCLKSNIWGLLCTVNCWTCTIWQLIASIWM